MVSSKGNRESLLGGAITGEYHEREGTRLKSMNEDKVGGGPHCLGLRATCQRIEGMSAVKSMSPKVQEHI